MFLTRCCSILLLCALLVVPLTVGAASDAWAADTAGADAGPCAAPSEALRDELFRIEHEMHALQLELMALQARLARLAGCFEE